MSTDSRLQTQLTQPPTVPWKLVQAREGQFRVLRVILCKTLPIAITGVSHTFIGGRMKKPRKLRNSPNEPSHL
jgi:hypothetical protein